MSTEPSQLHFTARWSDEDSAHVGLCTDFPSLSWLAPSEAEALSGIRHLATEVLSDLKTEASTNRADSMAEAIRKIFVEDWDPLGLMSDPKWSRDEYDVYISQVRDLVVQGASAEVIASLLRWIEERQMGLAAEQDATRLSVARKLILTAK